MKERKKEVKDRGTKKALNIKADVRAGAGIFDPDDIAAARENGTKN